MKKSIIIGGTVGFLLILTFGVYFFVRGSKPDDLNSQRSQLQSDLATIQGKLAEEKQKLAGMIDDVKQSFALAVAIQDQMRQAATIVNKTNFMFNNPNGINPTLIVKNPLTGLPINDQRKNVNSLLADWQNKLGISGLKLIDITVSENIRKNAEDIQTYLDSLSQIVDKLTPGNSGLSQFQIDTYKERLPSPNEIKQVINSIDDAIKNPNNKNSPPSNIQPDVPPVTPDDVIKQQAVVDFTQNQVDSIQEQIKKVDDQAQPPPPEVTPPVDTPPTPPDNIPPPSTNNTINYGVIRTIDKNQGIIVQPGPPQLIPGTDPF